MSHSEQSLTPPLAGRLWLLTALWLVALPQLWRMPLWLALLCSAAFLWRLLHELRGYDLPGRLLRFLLVGGGIAAVAGAYHTVVGPEAGVSMLAVMLCLKLLELRTMRDAMLAIFIGYFMVIGGFLFSQTIFMGAYLLLVVLLLTASLVALNHPASQMAGSLLYLRSGGKLLLQSLPLMILMFLLFPRLSNPLWSMPESSASARTGLSNSIEMGSVSNLVQSNEVAFRVDFEGELPPADSLYWRGPVMWETDGKRWERVRLGISRNLPEFENLGEEVAYTITLEPHRRRWIFALDLPLERPTGSGLDVYLLPDFQMLNASEVGKKLRYDLRSATRYRFDDYSFEMELAATRLPDDANPRSLALAQRWRDDGLSDSELVERAYRYFREQPFYYTRQPPKLGDDPVDEFLFETRRGFCEHYASAFVTLVRAAGVPARVVAGYQGGEYNEVGDYLIVRQSNAHAWAEVWLEGEGWVRYDPTTAVPPSRVESNLDAARFESTSVERDSAERFAALHSLYRQLIFSWDALNHTWNQWVLGFDRQKQRELLQKLGLEKLSWEWMIGLMVGLVMGVLGLITAFTLLRRPRQRDPVLRLYQQFCDKLARAGLPRERDEGPVDYARRIIAERPELEGPVRQITRLYTRLRYTRHGRGQDLQSLRRMVRALRF